MYFGIKKKKNLEFCENFFTDQQILDGSTISLYGEIE